MSSLYGIAALVGVNGSDHAASGVVDNHGTVADAKESTYVGLRFAVITIEECPKTWIKYDQPVGLTVDATGNITEILLASRVFNEVNLLKLALGG